MLFSYHMCFACNLYGTWLFLKTRFDIPLFREPYLHCFLSVFPELLVYCSRDSKLSEVCPSFFDQMPGSCPYFTCKIGLVILKIAYVYFLRGISWLNGKRIWLAFWRAQDRVGSVSSIFSSDKLSDLTSFHDFDWLRGAVTIVTVG